MKIKKRIIILALFFAVVTAGLFYSYLTQLEEPETVAFQKKEVLVAAATIPENTLITQDLVMLKSVPLESVHGEALKSMEAAVGYLAKSDIVAGEQVLSSRVASDLTSSSLSYRIPDGMRATALSSTEVSAVAGFIAVGDRVDILVTYTDVEGSGLTTLTQFQNLEVLAKGASTSGETGAQSDTGVSSTLTLLVTPAQAEVLAYAMQSGNLHLTLRNPSDTEKVLVDKFNRSVFDSWKSR